MANDAMTPYQSKLILLVLPLLGGRSGVVPACPAGAWAYRFSLFSRGVSPYAPPPHLPDGTPLHLGAARARAHSAT